MDIPRRATRNPGQEPCALVTNLRALTGAATGTQLRILGMLTCLDGSLYLEDTHTVWVIVVLKYECTVDF